MGASWLRSWLPRLSRWKENRFDVDGVGGVDSEKNDHGVEGGDDNALYVVAKLDLLLSVLLMFQNNNSTVTNVTHFDFENDKLQIFVLMYVAFF